MSFIPALGYHALTPLYQAVVDLLCRDDYIKELVADEVHALGQEMVVLDVACGGGKLVSLLASKQVCCRIHGRDIDPRMVAAAQELATGRPNLEIKWGDCTSLSDFENSTVDVAIESLVFHHLTDAQKVAAIDEIARVLRPQGVFIFVDWIKPETLLQSLAFKIVEVVDGTETTRAHRNNDILTMIEAKLAPSGVSHSVKTTCGTVGVFKFVKEIFS